jgi:hypothetical protein
MRRSCVALGSSRLVERPVSHLLQRQRELAAFHQEYSNGCSRTKETRGTFAFLIESGLERSCQEGELGRESWVR